MFPYNSKLNLFAESTELFIFKIRAFRKKPNLALEPTAIEAYRLTARFERAVQLIVRQLRKQAMHRWNYSTTQQCTQRLRFS